ARPRGPARQQGGQGVRVRDRRAADRAAAADPRLTCDTFLTVSEPVTPPPLPVTWRPRRGRIVAYTFAALIVAGAVIMAILIAPPFQLPDRIGIVAFGCAVAYVLHMLGRVRVEADEEGITLV